jgi:Rrf2 family transcriptional regulator, cysteine metabolism repressor
MIYDRGQRTGFLHFSQKIDYGLMLLVELTKNGKKAFVSLRTVADENGISFFFLQKIASDLRKAGLVNADRGKNGGYALSKPAGKITLMEILEALEGPLNVMPCLSLTEGISCARSKRCSIRPGLNFINQTIIKALSSTSLSDLTNNYGQA